MAARKLGALLAAVLQLCLCQIAPEIKPEFLAPLENHTVIQGREASFTCVVNHLQSYKVAWIKSDSRAILAIQTHMVAHNPRLSVTHNGHNTWKLHIANVQKSDRGSYMCQVNYDPMLCQTGYMDVVIPPDIMDDDSANGLVVNEGENVRLRCAATGVPEPHISWKRQDGKNIFRDGELKGSAKYEGEVLELKGILRQDMGSYLCIASNGIPPIVSKRYSLRVHFQPVVKVKSQLVGTPVNSNVTLQCIVEASPPAMNTWYRDTPATIISDQSESSGVEKLLPSAKYEMVEYALNEYTWQMNLTIYNLTKEDCVSYRCSSDNALGKAEEVIRLQALNLSLMTTQSTLIKAVDPRPRKKPVKPTKKKISNRKAYENNVDKLLDDVNSSHEAAAAAAAAADTVTTQVMGQGHRTERPLVMPSSISPPWVTINSARTKQIVPWRVFAFPLFSLAVIL